MFEKDAEEYAQKHTFYDEYRERDRYDKPITEIFKDGAEFGYNKANEDSDKMKSQFLELCNLKDMRIAELEKANEWHYVKDELPDHNGKFYVALKGQAETFILNYDYDESEMVWLDDDDTNFDDEVYAWREKLKAPKESE